MKVLLDINVILDVLQQRDEHYDAAAKLFSLCADKRIRGFISANSFGTLYYILSKFQTKANALSYLKKIRAITEVANVDRNVIDLAIAANFKDFEDAIQYYCAVQNSLEYIITRNKKDFKKARIPVSTPAEFLCSIQAGDII